MMIARPEIVYEYDLAALSRWFHAQYHGNESHHVQTRYVLGLSGRDIEKMLNHSDERNPRLSRDNSTFACALVHQTAPGKPTFYQAVRNALARGIKLFLRRHG